MNFTWEVTYLGGTRVRSEPTINALQSFELLPLGKKFSGPEAIKTVEKTGIVGWWVQLPDGRWTASVYNGKTFMKSTVVTLNWTPGLYRVNHDFPARTANPGWGGVGAQTPEVFPLFPTTNDNVGSIFTDVSGFKDTISRLNAGDAKKLDYLYRDATALFTHGKLESLTMGGNVVQIDQIVNGFGQVHTFQSIPDDWTWLNHPEAIHRFVVVYWVATAKLTKWIDPPPGYIYWPLVSYQQLWIPMSRVNVYPYLNPLT